MRRIAICTVVIGLLAGVSYATNYNFVGVQTDRTYDWDNAANWSPSLALPTTSGDNFIIAGLSYAAGDTLKLPGTAGTYYFGEINMVGGTLEARASANITYRIVGDNGHSGDINLTGLDDVRYSEWNTVYYKTLDIDGNLNFPKVKSSWRQYRRTKLVLRGADKFVKMGATGLNYGVDNITVKSGADYDFQKDDWGTNPTLNKTGALTVEAGGAATGNMNFYMKDTSQPLSIVGAGDTTDLNVHFVDYYTSTSTIPTQGGQLPGRAYGNVDFNVNKTGASWDSTRTVHIIGGDLLVKGDLELPIGYAGSRGVKKGAYWVLDTDNDGTVVNVAVEGSMYIGRANGFSWGGIEGGLIANSSTIDVGGDMVLGGDTIVPLYDAGGYIEGGTATFYIGGDWNVTMATASAAKHDMGTSTVIFDGNGTSASQTIASKYYPFYSVTINNPGGTVTLGGDASDNLLIKGDLQILAGTFDTNDRVVTFNGPDHLLNDQVGVVFDNADLLADAVVQMASDITVTNLMMATNSEVYLNGFTLDADGQSFSGSGQWSFDNGTIFGVVDIPGDSNGDGKVDGGDLAIWQQNYDPLGGGNNTFALGDWNGDGKIDGGDLALWQQNYDPIGPTGADGMGANVPEPTTLLLLGTGLAGAIGCVRRRRMR